MALPKRCHYDAARQMIVFERNEWALRIMRRLGWDVEFEGLPAQALPSGRVVSRGVVVAYPHTTNWDGFFGWLTVLGLGLDLHIWAKASLFRVPLLASFLRAMGAVPIDRTDPRGLVGATVANMQQQDVYWLGLAPEGTRKKLPGWRSGFYHVALAADVPVALAYLDWQRKRVGVKHFVRLTGDADADMKAIASAYEGVVGYSPADASPPVLLDVSYSRKEAVVP